ncbi:ATP-binding domain-containing protein [Vibrio cholerae]|nr:ATP-binding domain-containing protein [Vibrio cholerae]EKF9153557.1 ATP-binding domain-containing protein [Vibrio cholerae]EKF9627463.1 ATP-binding domain-containing protein [Vibrio cholerae]EKF9647158.1 ATP-binding domain-containing protein [Vibrio cholerae]EKF9651159.1 ATP-binding domain-containing protein [Vibrio cholerae]
MTININSRECDHIEALSHETLDKLSAIASAANAGLQCGAGNTANAFANINTLTSSSAVQNLGQIDAANRESYRVLTTEPAIARVVVLDDTNKKRIYYICRTTPVTGVQNLASYRAPIGRLASLAIGNEFPLPNGTVLEVLERSLLHPVQKSDGWDSRNTLIESEDFGPLTIESLRALLAKDMGETEAEDLVAQLLAEESEKASVFEGVRRTVITKMGLRDQPILDQFQDEIFRLPLNRRLLLLGPPGTGKTTTLIRRLGQKLDTAFLEESEQHLVNTTSSGYSLPHANSWLMFTPTELLKQYLKEAFSREGVPASDQRIRTWQDYRRELARNTFGVLRTASGGGTFVLKDALPSLTDAALAEPIRWFEAFNTWQRARFVEELKTAAQWLSECDLSEASAIGDRLLAALTRSANAGLSALISAIADELNQLQQLIAHSKEETDKRIKAALNLQLNRNRRFLDELANYLDTLQVTTADEAEDPDEDEDEPEAPKTGRAAALSAYMQAARVQARAVANKRSISKTSRTGKIIEWLDDRGLQETERPGVGMSLLMQTQARRFANPVKRYLDSIPKRYRSFRREHQQNESWYQAAGYETRDIHPLELDVVLLAILRSAGEFLSSQGVLRDIESPLWSPLQMVLSHYRNQVLVDEATDFSPLQLACMAALTHPRLRSFFACGDFNQRLTTWGARSQSDLTWVFADLEIREVTVAYRQSQQLNALARAIINTVGGTEQSVSLPQHVDNTGVAPALLEGASEQTQVIDWLAQRIREIEQFVGQLPSTAIFVNSENDVAPIAEALNAALEDHNIAVVACREGQAVGQESSVRVFDIQHIKGLEFEAVFFLGLDRLADLTPELFDKYLYVGTTRAATYLGITCESTLPLAITSLREHFTDHW